MLSFVGTHPRNLTSWTHPVHRCIACTKWSASERGLRQKFTCDRVQSDGGGGNALNELFGMAVVDTRRVMTRRPVDPNKSGSGTPRWITRAAAAPASWDRRRRDTRPLLFRGCQMQLIRVGVPFKNYPKAFCNRFRESFWYFPSNRLVFAIYVHSRIIKKFYFVRSLKIENPLTFIKIRELRVWFEFYVCIVNVLDFPVS